MNVHPRGILATLPLLAVGLASAAAADPDPVRNTHEAIVDEAQIATDKQQIQRDRTEVAHFEKLLVRLDVTHREKDPAGYERIAGLIHRSMTRERDQVESKLTQAQREVRQSRRELRAERREARQTGKARDRMQKRDDRRDLRDDRRDRESAEDRVDQMDALLEESAALRKEGGSWATVDATQHRALLDEFFEVMRADLGATQGELHEDRRERREDRRERRTDRRS